MREEHRAENIKNRPLNSQSHEAVALAPYPRLTARLPPVGQGIALQFKTNNERHRRTLLCRADGTTPPRQVSINRQTLLVVRLEPRLQWGLHGSA